MARLIALLIFGGLGGMLLVVGSMQWLRQRRALRSAVPVDAVITRSEVSSSRSVTTGAAPLRDHSTTSYTPEVRFRYVVAGREHEGDRLYPTSIARGFASAEAAREALGPFALGARVTAWVDPARPAEGFLVREASHAPAVFVVLGVMLPPLAWAVGGLL